MVGRLQPRFVHLVKAYLGEHDITQKALAEKLEIPESHLSNLLKFNETGYRRTLSCNYIYTFLAHEVFRMDEIYDEKPESAREKEAWQIMNCLSDRPLQRKIAILKDRGFDLHTVLDGLIKSTDPR